MACEILVPWPAIKLRPQTRALAVKAPSSNHWTAREFPEVAIFFIKIGGVNPTKLGPEAQDQSLVEKTA